MAQAKAAQDAGDINAAANIYQQVLAHDRGNPVAAAGLLRCLLAAGDAAEARQLYDGLPPEMKADAEIAAALHRARARRAGGQGGRCRRAGGAARHRPQGPPGALRPGARALRRRPHRGGARRAAGAVPARPQLERPGGAQAAGQDLRRARPRQRAGDQRPPASVVPDVRVIERGEQARSRRMSDDLNIDDCIARTCRAACRSFRCRACCCCRAGACRCTSSSRAMSP